ncbi:carbohydrate ABC transporter permease [Cohnella fermenti]|uniref:Carbohydrate ABC transporter permease n=1 Tax=Cohnella fermenti TaxID=2565925 RepID=A0A4S4BQC1_9BACL|nr:carbohydrate ABC transporter permease [Cohnella fermenti]THF77129.1 carbohydrate ABC transporter permease [Cohnella fermenti]
MNSLRTARTSRLRKPKRLANVVMLAITLFYLLPFWYIANNAIKNADEISTHPFTLTLKSITLDNLRRAYAMLHFPTAFLNSLILLVLSLALLVSLGSLAAYGIVIPRSRFMNRLYTLLVALISVPFQITIVPLVGLLKQLGLINSFLGVAFVYAAMYLPFVIFLYVGFMRTIPRELAESSQIDGSGMLRTYLLIYMPLLKSITGIVMIVRGVSVWNDLLAPLVVLYRNSMYTLPIQLYVFSSSKIGQWDLVFGGTLLVCLPITVFFLLMQRSFVKGIMAGGIKG